MVEIKLLEDALDSITHVLGSLKLQGLKKDQSSKNKYYSIIFLHQIYELSSDIKILITNNSLNSVPIILRSITDCLYSIWNMEKFPDFIDSLAFKSVSEEEKRVRMLKKDTKVVEYWDDWKKQFDNESPSSDLKKYTNIHGNEKLYRMVYSKLSKTVHNDLLTLDQKFSAEINGKIQYGTGISEVEEDMKFVVAVVVSLYCSIVSILNIHGNNSEKYQKKINEIVDGFIGRA